MAKPFLSYGKQIAFLEQDKQLIISDREFAETMLRRIGYFNLIGGYKIPFKNPTTKKYRDGTTFEDIVALYKFDENLRELFLKYILQFELHIRSLLSYYFTEKYGENQSHYLDMSNYYGQSDDVAKLIGKLRKLAVENSDYPYINHQRNKYGNVPLWILVGGLTFGTISKMYSCITPDLQAKISKNFDGVNEKQLGQYLSVITKFRNVCAHNERLFSYQTRNDIPNTDLHRKLSIPMRGEQYIYGKKDLFAVVIAFRYLLPDADFKKFKKRLSNIFLSYFKGSQALTTEDLYDLMGFPLNWNDITHYQK